MLAGHGSLVLVSGEAGIGKTTLVEWLAAEVEEHGCVVLRGGCYDLSVTPPYGPWVEAARNYRADDDGPNLPEFFTNADALDLVGSQHALFDQATQFFHQLTERQPTVVVLEDLHWADPGTIEFLRYLARQSRQHRLLLVATHRSDELQRQHPLAVQLPLLVRESDAERVELRPLDVDGHRQLIRSRYQLSASDQSRLENYLQSHGEGNPLFAGELLRTLEEEGLLRPDGTEWNLGVLSGVRVPTLLRQVIDGRLARLGEHARDRLAEAALIGEDVPLDLWAAISGTPESDLLRVLDRAIEARVLDPTDRGARFTHALIRKAIYDSVLPVRRRVWHRQIAEALVERPNPDPDLVAYHLQQADDARAIEWLQQAGERAERAYAWVTAADRFEAAAGLMAGDASHGVDRAVLLTRAATLQRYTNPQRSVLMLEEARRVAIETNNPALSAYARSQMGLLRCFAHDLKAGLEDLKTGSDALDALTPNELSQLEALGLNVEVDNDRGTYALWLSMTGHFREALDHGRRVMAAFPYPSGQRTEVATIPSDAYYAVGQVLAKLGRPDEALRTEFQSIEIQKAKEHFVLVCWQTSTALCGTVIPYRTDDLALRDELARESIEAARHAVGALADWPPEHAVLPLMALEGNWAKVREIAPLLRKEGHPAAFHLMSAPTVGNVARCQGDIELAWSLVHEQIPQGPAYSPEDDLLYEAAIAMRLAVSLSLDANDLESAHAWLESHDRWLAWSGAVLGQAEGTLLWARYQHRTATLAWHV